MAGDWIKMRNNLWDDPRVSNLCDLTGLPEAMVVGGLYWLWASADEHSEDGHMPGLSVGGIDRKTGCKGLGAGLLSIGWIEETPDGLTLLRFDEHNGKSAKRRCLDAQRKANDRNPSASDADNERNDDGQISDNCGAREEKRREEEKKPSASSSSPTIPCPYDQIVECYHDRLPSLPRAKLMSPSRQKALRKFWGWVLSSKKSDGNRRASTAMEALAWIDSYFVRAADNDFLMGRTPRGGEHANWRCDIDFLLSEKGMKQVIEKTAEAA
jgi:hypothetical protein